MDSGNPLGDDDFQIADQQQPEFLSGGEIASDMVDNGRQAFGLKFDDTLGQERLGGRPEAVVVAVTRSVVLAVLVVLVEAADLEVGLWDADVGRGGGRPAPSPPLRGHSILPDLADSAAAPESPDTSTAEPAAAKVTPADFYLSPDTSRQLAERLAKRVDPTGKREIFIAGENVEERFRKTWKPGKLPTRTSLL